MSWIRPGSRRPRNSDELAVRRAAFRVGLQVAAAVAVVVVLLLAGAAVFLWIKSQPAEVLAHLDRTEPQVVLDAVDVLGALLVGGVAGVVLGGVVGLVSARRAVKPLGEALALQRRFVQDASHELRTPLAVLDTRIQLAQKRLGPESEAAPVLAELRADAGTLASVISDLLHSAASPGPDVPEEPVELGRLAREAVADLAVLAGEKRVELVADAGPEPVSVAVEAAPLRRVIVALVDNALKYTPEGGRVVVGVRALPGTGRGTTALLTVRDTGPGIAGPSPEQVFERHAGGAGFRAASSAESGESEGPRRSYGLGLALVREIAVRNGGSVRIAETGAGGTTLEVSFPAAPTRLG
ncbi:HAMP domain-containing sensor histidine kinase [Sinomonas sp. ASV322]|uniref:sensor histidine kinase n=1 Tax=Sinomonas sp. ASV322 TaxID=3041920 RepID=UPI0027DE28BD|nr:HAMP domain-containing sensor histidine kinase [Sinomonas sp. ASV322]MDQ4502805.1 HAMP domain-containing sensor histidine kinase [Sinomonas sp. ASV322]